MSDCEREGIAGNCGPDCRALQDGECPNEEMVIEAMVNCDRCESPLPKTVRIQSWFTNDILCGACVEYEDKLRSVLREKGITDKESKDCGPVAFGIWEEFVELGTSRIR
jgi:hypothetical protein